MATMAANIHESGHPLIMHKITQMRKAAARPKYLHTLIKEVSTFLCYEATKDLPLEACDVQTLCGAERGLRIAQRVGVVPVLRGGLGMVEAMTEFCSNAQVWHLGIYRDKKSLLPVEYYNKLPKRITVQTVFVLDPMPMSGATAVAAMDILKAWGSSVPGAQLRIKFVCLGASEKALAYISESHPDVDVHVGLIDRVQVAGRARCPRAARAPPAQRPRRTARPTAPPAAMRAGRAGPAARAGAPRDGRHRRPPLRHRARRRRADRRRDGRDDVRRERAAARHSGGFPPPVSRVYLWQGEWAAGGRVCRQDRL